MKKKYTLLTISLMALLAVGCGSKNENKADTKPVKLVKLEQTKAQLREVTHYNVSASTKSDVLRLRVQSEQGVDFVINPKGVVSAYQGKQRLWETRVSKQGLTAGVEVAEGYVIVANSKGLLFALHQQSGQIAWQAQLGSAVLAPSLIQQGRVITLANDGTVYAHNLQNGQQLWAYKLPNGQFSLRGQAAPISADGRSVIVSATNGYIYVLDGVSGLPLIQRRVALSDGRSEITRLVDVDGEPILIGSLLITTSYQGQVTATDLNQQRVVWSVNASSNKAAATDGEKIFVSHSDGKLSAYDLVSGRELWVNQHLLRRQLSNPVMFNGQLVVGDLEGVLHIINPETGEFMGREKTKGAVSLLYVDDQKLYVSTRKGTLSVWTRES